MPPLVIPLHLAAGEDDVICLLRSYAARAHVVCARKATLPDLVTDQPKQEEPLFPF